MSSHEVKAEFLQWKDGELSLYPYSQLTNLYMEAKGFNVQTAKYFPYECGSDFTLY